MVRPNLSMVIPFYCCSPYLRECVLSVLNEGICGLEIITVDDASTDDSLERIADLPVTVLRHKRRKGPAAARNEGLSVCQGEFVAFLDADDVLVRNGLRWRLDYLNKNPLHFAVAGAIAGVIGSRGETLHPHSVQTKNQFDAMAPLWSDTLLNSGKLFPSPLSLILFRRPAIDTLGPMDEGLFYASDVDYLYRIFRLGSFPFVNQGVIKYRLHESNHSVESKNGDFVIRPAAVASATLVSLQYGSVLPA